MHEALPDGLRQFMCTRGPDDLRQVAAAGPGTGAGALGVVSTLQDRLRLFTSAVDATRVTAVVINNVCFEAPGLHYM